LAVHWLYDSELQALLHVPDTLFHWQPSPPAMPQEVELS
jgi:hypothetical protein